MDIWDKFGVGGNVEDAVLVDLFAEGVKGEVFIHEERCRDRCQWHRYRFFDDSLQFFEDIGEGVEAIDTPDRDQGQGCWRSDFAKAVGGVGEVSRKHCGDGVVFDQELLAIVESGHGKVASGAVLGEDETLNVVVL